MTAKGGLRLTTVHSIIRYRGMFLIGLGEPIEGVKEYLHWIKPTKELEPKSGDALLILRSENFWLNPVLAVSLVKSFVGEGRPYSYVPEKLVPFPGYPEEIILEDIKPEEILDRRN